MTILFKHKDKDILDINTLYNAEIIFMYLLIIYWRDIETPHA